MENSNEITYDDLVEITLAEPDDFLIVKETLTRIGISSKKTNTLWQSAHILHKRGKYYIVHFKELFALDGKPTDISEQDIGRRNTITNLLQEWGLVKIVNPERCKIPVVPLNYLKIVKASDKVNWKLEPKFTIGKKRVNNHE